jgi:WD40 repeat protein
MNFINLNFKNYTNIKISNDNQYLAAATPSRVYIYDFNSFKVITQFTEIKNPSYFEFSSDNKLLAIKSTSGAISLFSLESNSFLRKFKYFREAGDGSNINFTPDNQFIIDGDWLGNVRLIHINDGLITVLEKNENTMIRSINYDDEEKVFHIHKFYRGGTNITDESHHSVSRWKYNLNEKKLTFLNETEKLSRIGDELLYNKEKKYYFNIHFKSQRNKQREIVVYNYMLDSIILRRSIEGEVINYFTRSSISPNGAYLGIAFANKVQIYSTEEFTLEKEINIEFPKHINFTFDNKYFYITNQNGNAYIYSVEKEDLFKDKDNFSDLTVKVDYVNLLGKLGFDPMTIDQIPDDVLTEVIIDFTLHHSSNNIMDEYQKEITDVFYQTWWFESEESEGGIYQYFYNNSDEGSMNRLMNALSLINAEKTLNFVKKIFIELLEKDFEDIFWDKYQEIFNEITEDLDLLRINYVRSKLKK